LIEITRAHYVGFSAMVIVIGGLSVLPLLKPRIYAVETRSGTVLLKPGMPKSKVEQLLGRELPESPTQLRGYTESLFAVSPKINFVLIFHKGRLDAVHTPQEMRSVYRQTQRGLRRRW
jgi:hypothetical protein